MEKLRRKVKLFSCRRAIQYSQVWDWCGHEAIPSFFSADLGGCARDRSSGCLPCSRPRRYRPRCCDRADAKITRSDGLPESLKNALREDVEPRMQVDPVRLDPDLARHINRSATADRKDARMQSLQDLAVNLVGSN